MTSATRLDVGRAFQDGWDAFSRAPWVFTGFALLYIGIGVGLVFVELALVTPFSAASAGAEATVPAPILGAILLCRLVSFGVGVWGLIGTVRGAWIALQGRRPAFADLLHADGRGCMKVVLAMLLLSLLLGAVLVPLVALALVALDQLVDFSFPLSGPPLLRSFLPGSPWLLLLLASLLAMLAFPIYLQVNQHFLVQLASLRHTGPLQTLSLGRRTVDPHWGQVLALIALESLLLLAGGLALLVGLFAALPLVACISTAAYRQLFPDGAHPAVLPTA